MPITVSIVEDQKEIRQMLEILVRGSEGLKLLQSFSNAEDAIKKIPSSAPDVMLVDIHLPKMSGIEMLRTLKPLCTNTQFIMCTSMEDSENIFSALKAGANGYIVKSTAPAKLLEAITEVHNGGSPMSSQIARKVVGNFQQQKNSLLEKLSRREQEILELLSKGFRYKEIADQLFLSIETIRTHVRNMYEKLQVNSRTEALNKVKSGV